MNEHLKPSDHPENQAQVERSGTQTEEAERGAGAKAPGGAGAEAEQHDSEPNAVNGTEIKAVAAVSLGVLGALFAAVNTFILIISQSEPYAAFYLFPSFMFSPFVLALCALGFFLAIACRKPLSKPAMTGLVLNIIGILFSGGFVIWLIMLTTGNAV